MALARTPIPLRIDLEDGGVRIAVAWPGDRITRFDAFALRAECPCAGCVDEMTGRRTLRVEDLDPGVRAVDYGWIGRYAVRFVWSDGHDTGLFTFERLLAGPGGTPNPEKGT
jgi:DUF971 family protein